MTAKRSGSVIGVFLCAAAILLPVDPARADATCNFESNKVKVRFSDDGDAGEITRVGVAIEFNGGACTGSSGIATVLNTDEINVRDNSNGGSTSFFVDLSGGQFEDGSDEIPMKIDLRTGTRDVFGVAGSMSGDFMHFGSEGANLQDDADGEISFESSPDVGLAAGGDGGDKMCAAGGHGTGPEGFFLWGMTGGTGADIMCGSATTDVLSGQSGPDRIKGRSGGDILRGRGGDDRLVGRRGNDQLYGNKGADVLLGGPGIDTCKGGPGPNASQNCE